MTSEGGISFRRLNNVHSREPCRRHLRSCSRTLLRQINGTTKIYQVYRVAGERIGALIQDKDHYMHDKLTKVEPVIKRLEIMQQLAQRKQAGGADGVHSWMLKGSGLQCSACGMHLKASSTHEEIARKDGAPCPGTRSKTLLEQMKDLIDVRRGTGGLCGPTPSIV